MSCCGKKNEAAQPVRYSMAIFRYDGNTSLTVYGASGKRYRFSEPGAEVAVDPRDRESLRKVPVLREVRLA
jgi:hypothetical protein